MDTLYCYKCFGVCGKVERLRISDLLQTRNIFCFPARCNLYICSNQCCINRTDKTPDWENTGVVGIPLKKQLNKNNNFLFWYLLVFRDERQLWSEGCGQMKAECGPLGWKPGFPEGGSSMHLCLTRGLILTSLYVSRRSMVRVKKIVYV